MTREELKNIVRHIFHFYEVNAENCNWADMNEACGEILKALEILEEFEKAQIITGGRLNGRTYAYKCGLEDGKRKALEQKSKIKSEGHVVYGRDSNLYELTLSNGKEYEQESVCFPPCVDCNTKMNEIREAYDKLKNQAPCEDAISREETFEELNSLNGTAELDMAFEVIEKLPSVIPTRKKGHWVKEYIGCMYDVCSECGQKMTTGYFEYEYCPNCGAKMGSEVEI